MSKTILQLDALRSANAEKSPYTHLVASGVLSDKDKKKLNADFPEIATPGFFPLESLGELRGSFKILVHEMQSSELADILSEKLGVDLRGKPSIVTVRKWSAIKDGPVHNDGASKIVTALVYLTENWPEDEEGGRFAVLSSDKGFQDTVTEVIPSYGMFSCFVRSDNSWHGHKPFAGERRVVQIAWLKSMDDLHRKTRRGRISHFLKGLWKKFL